MTQVMPAYAGAEATAPGAPGYYPQPQPPMQQGYVGNTPGYDQPTYDNRAQPGAQYVHGGYGAPQPANVTVVNVKHKEKKEKHPEWPIIVFILGIFICPIWLFGFCMLKKKKYGKVGRGFSIASIVCAVINLIWIIIVIAVVATAASRTKKGLDDLEKELNNYYSNSPYYAPSPPSPWYNYGAPSRP